MAAVEREKECGEVATGPAVVDINVRRYEERTPLGRDEHALLCPPGEEGRDNEGEEPQVGKRAKSLGRGHGVGMAQKQTKCILVAED